MPEASDPMTGLGQIGELNPQQWEELTVGTARLRSLHSISTRNLIPRGRAIAFDYTESFAHLLFTQADETYVRGVGQLVEHYHNLERAGKSPDDAILLLFDFANLEMRRQQRLGREGPTLTVAERFVQEMR